MTIEIETINGPCYWHLDIGMPLCIERLEDDPAYITGIRLRAEDAHAAILALRALAPVILQQRPTIGGRIDARA